MKYGKRSYSILGHSGIDASVLRNVKMPDYLNHDEFDGQTRKKQGDNPKYQRKSGPSLQS